MVNNMIYGMTGGQVAPTTPMRVKTSTTPYGSFEYPLDAARLAVTAKACYVARWTTVHHNELRESMKKAIGIHGFRFVEVMSQCPTAYGRRAGFKSVREMLTWFEQNSVRHEQTQKMSEEDLVGKIVVGEFVNIQMPTLGDALYERIKEAKAKVEEN
jgi:2-oxoglutarate ferredoxin oxidoreductase subunit beta